jgi:hypothetical protein
LVHSKQPACSNDLFFFPAEQLTCKASDFDVNMDHSKAGTKACSNDFFFSRTGKLYSKLILTQLGPFLGRNQHVQVNGFFQSAFLYIASDFDFEYETLQKDC